MKADFVPQEIKSLRHFICLIECGTMMNKPLGKEVFTCNRS
jgi:hypothetical protein